jgi:hypothetical protein
VIMNLEKRSSSHIERFPKTLFILSRCRIAKDDGSRDLLSQSQMNIDERAKVTMATQQRRRRKSRCVGGSWLFIVTSSVAATHIYREDPPRVTASHNRLVLSIKTYWAQTCNKNKWQKKVVDPRGFELNLFGNSYGLDLIIPTVKAYPHLRLSHGRKVQVVNKKPLAYWLHT